MTVNDDKIADCTDGYDVELIILEHPPRDICSLSDNFFLNFRVFGAQYSHFFEHDSIRKGADLEKQIFLSGVHSAELGKQNFFFCTL